MKKITVLGSTGSIGLNALKIIEDNSDRFSVAALVARSSLKKLAAQIEQFRPRMVSVANKEKAKALRAMVKRRVKIVYGVEGAVQCSADSGADMVLSAMVGAAGLAPTLAALKAGIDVALANKETMVTAGELVVKEARAGKARIIPVDSEHSAIFQALRGEKKKNARKLILTASGGPFLRRPLRTMKDITVKETLNHPNWSMGQKITIDSATMINKGFEVIEARWLFNIPLEKIEVVVHPESIIHSMVEFHDSSIIAQLGIPDMRTPIAFALSYPERLELNVESLDLAKIGKLTFESPNMKKFPSLKLAYDALNMGGSAPAVLNAANEVAVEAFLVKRIKFIDIPRVIEKTLGLCKPAPVNSLADALAWDNWARSKATEFIKNSSL